MGLRQLTRSFPWSRYSQRLSQKILNPRSIGIFTEEAAQERKMRLVVGKEGSLDDGNCVRIFCLIDPEDGIIADARFQFFGSSALLGGCEMACETLVGKHYEQAGHLTAYLLDRPLRDKDTQEAFPDEMRDHLDFVVSAIHNIVEQCEGLPEAETYVAPPVPELEVTGEGYPGWLELPLPKKLAVIEKIMDEELRPYIEMDGGGVEIINLIDDRELIIAYQGACTSCFSAVGATLSYIQQVLRAKVHPDLVVVPDMSGTNIPY